ncbi:MAG: hypothetical protein KDK97_19860, partial [Verrucomicrobiales bacterium]|nr:hypothetical protein [Verrucomicrobiales bacterium]
MKYIALASALLLCCAIDSSGMSRKPKFTISVHSEGTMNDSPKTIFPDTVDGRQVVFKKVPEFSHANIAAFHAFPAENGDGYGVTLKLDFKGAGALELITRTSTGGMLRSVVNGHPVDVVMMDRPIADGIFTIWQGVPESVVKELGKKYPSLKGLTSAAGSLEMTPTTKTEKKKSFWRFREGERAKAAEDKRKAAGKDPKAKDYGSGTSTPIQDDPSAIQVPRGASTTDIPVEGGAPPLLPGDLAPLPGDPAAPAR